MVEASTLIACLEDYAFLASCGRSGGVRPISYAGVRGHRSGLPSPLTNLVGALGPNVEIPERSIDAVFTEFGRRNLPFTWVIGPNSPEGMSWRLRRRGMTELQHLSGMATSDFQPGPLASSAFIREARAGEQDLFESVLTDTFELEREVASFLGIHYFFAPTLRTRNYLAFVGDSLEPVAVASSVYDAGRPLVVLAIAAVKEQFRGRGVYQDLVRRRLADARADGARAALVHALPTSSEPICRRLGFRVICTQQLVCLVP